MHSVDLRRRALVRLCALVLSLLPMSALAGGRGPTLVLVQQISPLADQRIATGDFDGDGTTDVAVSGYRNASSPPEYVLRVLLNAGDGTLTYGPDTSVDFGGPVAAGDLDRDGRLDLVVLFDAPKVLLGRGDGTFAEGATLSRVPYARTIALGDVNGDGSPDVVLAGYAAASTRETSVAVYLGDGHGAFSEPAVYDVAHKRLRGSVVADFDGDGAADVAVATNTDVFVLLADGTGGLGAPARYALPFSIRSVASDGLRVGDFDADGLPDLAVPAVPSSSIGVLYNRGSGEFGPVAVPTNAAKPPAQVVAGDFDGDGVDDVLGIASYPMQGGTLFPGSPNGLRSGRSVYDYLSAPAPQAVGARLRPGAGDDLLIVTDQISVYGVR